MNAWGGIKQSPCATACVACANGIQLSPTREVGPHKGDSRERHILAARAVAQPPVPPRRACVTVHGPLDGAQVAQCCEQDVQWGGGHSCTSRGAMLLATPGISCTCTEKTVDAWAAGGRAAVDLQHCWSQGRPVVTLRAPNLGARA